MSMMGELYDPQAEQFIGRLVGNVKLGGNASRERGASFLRELESIMERYNVDMVSVSWSRNALLSELSTPTEPKE